MFQANGLTICSWARISFAFDSLFHGRGHEMIWPWHMTIHCLTVWLNPSWTDLHELGGSLQIFIAGCQKRTLTTPFANSSSSLIRICQPSFFEQLIWFDKFVFQLPTWWWKMAGLIRWCNDFIRFPDLQTSLVTDLVPKDSTIGVSLSAWN